MVYLRKYKVTILELGNANTTVIIAIIPVVMLIPWVTIDSSDIFRYVSDNHLS